MNAPFPRPSDCVYVVKLHIPDPAHPERMSGRVEHVASGRRHDFDNGPALLACMAHEQRQALTPFEGEFGALTHPDAARPSA